MSEGKVNWQGKSGNTYSFEIFNIIFNFNPNQDGNYIFAKQTQTGWDAVYIGEGDLKTRTSDEQHSKCAIRKGATHIHAHLNNNEKNRKAEETDLLEYNTEAYHPTGCNIKIGG